MLAEFFGSPMDKVEEWLNDLHETLGEFFTEMFTDMGVGLTTFFIEGAAISVIVYAVYCACRIMITSKDETFSEYLNKSMLAALGYFFAKYGGNLIIRAITG